jgi:hypothetical protein
LKWLAAIAGKSACGIPKTIAFVSSANVPRITGCRTRNRQPSRSDSSAWRATSPFGGAGATSSTATSEARNVAPSIRYAQPIPAAAISTPPSAGPAIAAVCA